MPQDWYAFIWENTWELLYKISLQFWYQKWRMISELVYFKQTKSYQYYSKGPFSLLLTQFNFNPSMDMQSHAQYSVRWNYLSIPKLQQLHCWSLGKDMLFHLTHYNTRDYLSMLGLKLNHVSKGPLVISVSAGMVSVTFNGQFHTCMRGLTRSFAPEIVK